MKRMANRTYVPLDGMEKGLPHYFFRTEEFKLAFQNFKILEAGFDNTNHYRLIGENMNGDTKYTLLILRKISWISLILSFEVSLNRNTAR